MKTPPAQIASAASDVIAAAREFIRREEGCIVSCHQLLEELHAKFGDQFRVSSEMFVLLVLIESLWADPHVDQVPQTGWVEFAWNEAGR